MEGTQVAWSFLITNLYLFSEELRGGDALLFRGEDYCIKRSAEMDGLHTCSHLRDRAEKLTPEQIHSVTVE